MRLRSTLFALATVTATAAALPFATLAQDAKPDQPSGSDPTLKALRSQFVPADHSSLRERALGVLAQQFGAFSDAAAGLEMQAAGYCAGTGSADAVKAQLTNTYLAWAPVESYTFGPMEEQGAALAINFWPDKKDYVGRGLRNLVKATPEDLRDPATVAAHSAAVQGLPALERVLYSEIEDCPVIVGISAHLAQRALQLHEGWFGPEGWAELVRTVGPDNPVYLSDREFTKALYTSITFSLTRVGDTRLGRPLGTFDRPMPKRAEAWRAGISLDIIRAQIDGITLLLDEGFAGGVFNPSREWVLDVIEDTQARIDGIGAPLHEAVADPALRIRVEGLQSKTAYLIQQFDENIGPELDVETGFSPADGD